MSPKAVSVLDQSGALLTGGDDAGHGAGLDAQQLQYVNQIEAGYTKRILELVEPIVGHDNLRASVTADIDFSQTEATSEEFKPNQGTDASISIRSQQTTEQGGGAGTALASGVPGAASNQPPIAATAPLTGASQPLQGAPTAGGARRHRRPARGGDQLRSRQDRARDQERDRQRQAAQRRRGRQQPQRHRREGQDDAGAAHERRDREARRRWCASRSASTRSAAIRSRSSTRRSGSSPRARSPRRRSGRARS